MEVVFSKIAVCNFGLLHFLKQWGFCSFVNLQQTLRKQKAAGFNTFKQIIIKLRELTVFATEAVVHKCSSKWPERPATLLKRDSNAGVFL